MHRQISIHSGSDFLRNELIAREGSRHGCALHFHGRGPKTGSAHGYPPLPTEGAESVARRAEEHHAPRAQRTVEVPLHGHAIMVWATQRRCQWAGWSHPVPQPTARRSLHAPKHVWLIHRVCVTRALGSRAQVEAAAVFGATVVLLGLQGRLWCALCTGCAQEALRQRLR